jgi:N-acetylneuraminic acid mutarotase
LKEALTIAFVVLLFFFTFAFFLLQSVKAEDSWTVRTPMPIPVYGLGTDVVNGKIYVMGGCIRQMDRNWETVNSVEVYDPSSDSWTMAADMPNQNSFFATTVVNNML